MLQIALKCADISNPCRSWQLCARWSKRVTTEFFDQGFTIDIIIALINYLGNKFCKFMLLIVIVVLLFTGHKEKELGIQISPLFDDTKHTTADIQVG